MTIPPTRETQYAFAAGVIDGCYMRLSEIEIEMTVLEYDFKRAMARLEDEHADIQHRLKRVQAMADAIADEMTIPNYRYQHHKRVTS